MKEQIEYDFDALAATVESIYGLRGIGVSAVYVSQALYDWMCLQFRNKANGWTSSHWCQCFDESRVECHETKTGALRMTFKPYGADRIVIRVKYTGKNPWKIVCGYRKES